MDFSDSARCGLTWLEIIALKSHWVLLSWVCEPLTWRKRWSADLLKTLCQYNKSCCEFSFLIRISDHLSDDVYQVYVCYIHVCVCVCIYMKIWGLIKTKTQKICCFCWHLNKEHVQCQLFVYSATTLNMEWCVAWFLTNSRQLSMHTA